MAERFAVWCRCGASFRGVVHPGRHVARLVAIFSSAHQDDGCELTTDPKRGRKWSEAARRRRNREIERAGRAS